MQKKILLTVFQYKKRTPPPVCIVMCIGLFFDIKFSFKISMMALFVGSYYRHHLRKSITYRQKPKGLYLSLSSLITLGKRLSVVSAQGLYNVLAGSYQAQARTALEILPSLEAERVAGLSKHIT
ncbi:TPA: hypothetical protein LUX75_000789 [Enterobacter hormaechei subsp. xiangfangensis]|nr:hypothetical protein [Enterobacter hormaechei]HBM2439532.1 hypothetical protein [Enterobacter hormaechei subsp. xiangfangensis]HBM2448834.1 hypothetical protein [Enterobacter hormaechei subsp. xiangfangensis]HBM2458086.1 hypothetical protein [Enterobacter hormaechei subsp. xiangfangensis]HBM2462765.1 hypothetical protein [Enterobacter hormaechei subsp. xiangfangensis]